MVVKWITKTPCSFRTRTRCVCVSAGVSFFRLLICFCWMFVLLFLFLLLRQLIELPLLKLLQFRLSLLLLLRRMFCTRTVSSYITQLLRWCIKCHTHTHTHITSQNSTTKLRIKVVLSVHFLAFQYQRKFIDILYSCIHVASNIHGQAMDVSERERARAGATAIKKREQSKRTQYMQCLHVFIKFSIRKSPSGIRHYTFGLQLSKWKPSSENERQEESEGQSRKLHQIPNTTSPGTL